MYYPMLKHGIDQLCISPFWERRGHKNWFHLGCLNKFPRPYAIPKNIIIRSKDDASARHPKIHAIPHTESRVTA